MATRSYVVDLPGGTASTSVQIQAAGSIKNVSFSMVPAAAGEVEFSINPSSQIGTAAPTADVQCRMRIGATAGGNVNQAWDLSVPVRPFQTVYIHQTGANVGTATLIV